MEERGLKAKIILCLVKIDHIGCIGILKLCPETDMLEGIALAEVIQRAADIEEVSLVTMELWARVDPLADHRPRFSRGGRMDLLIIRPKADRKGQLHQGEILQQHLWQSPVPHRLLQTLSGAPIPDPEHDRYRRGSLGSRGR